MPITNSPTQVMRFLELLAKLEVSAIQSFQKYRLLERQTIIGCRNPLGFCLVPPSLYFPILVTSLPVSEYLWSFYLFVSELQADRLHKM